MFGLPEALPNREDGELNRTLIGQNEPEGMHRWRNQPQLHRAQRPAARSLNWRAFFPKPLRFAFPFSSPALARTSNPNRPEGAGVQESTVIEFGTAREVLFACASPLQFADVLRLRNSDGTLDTEASVVAVQYHPGKTIVAARFVNSVPNWIVKS